MSFFSYWFFYEELGHYDDHHQKHQLPNYKHQGIIIITWVNRKSTKSKRKKFFWGGDPPPPWLNRTSLIAAFFNKSILLSAFSFTIFVTFSWNWLSQNHKFLIVMIIFVPSGFRESFLQVKGCYAYHFVQITIIFLWSLCAYPILHWIQPLPHDKCIFFRLSNCKWDS